jgi:hypothetical protein
VLLNRNREADIALSADSLDFGAVQTDSTNSLQFTITNYGVDSTLQVTDIASSDNVFTASPTSLSVLPDSSATVTVSFKPSALVSYNDSLTITCNDPNDPQVMVYLNGTGIDTNAPAVPTGLAAVSGDGEVNLTWLANSEIDLNHYLVYQGSTSGFDTTGTIVGQTIDTVFTATGLSNGTTYYFVVAAVDNTGNQSAASAEVGATPINYPPEITSSATASATEDSHFSYRAVATDPEDSTITFTFDLLPSWLDAEADSVFGTPLEGAVDTSFRIIASDGELTDTLVVAVTISPVNDAPMITSASTAQATEDKYFSYQATATDTEDSTLTWAFDLRPSWLNARADSVFGTPVEGDPDTLFRAIASDGELADTLVVTITVTPVNDPPLITSVSSTQTTEDEYFSYHATADDPESQVITWLFDLLPSWLTSDADSAFGVPLEGTVDTSFRVIASDGELTDTLVVDVTVTPVNEPPLITSPTTANATEDEYFGYRAMATDPEDSTVTFTFDLRPGWLGTEADSVFGTPLEGTVDTSFRIIAFDGDLYDTLVVAVTVTPVNDAPVVTSSLAAIAIEDEYFSYHATATDPEDSTIVWTFDILPYWLNAQADSVFGIPVEGDLDTLFRAIVSDGDLTDTLMASIIVTPVNDPPNITSPAATEAIEDTYFIYHAAAVDPENSTVTLSFDSLPVWLSFQADSVFGITPEGILSDSFKVVASDGELNDTLKVHINIIRLWPRIAISSDSLEFGQVRRDSTRSMVVEVFNLGADTLEVTDLILQLPVFQLQQEPFALAPLDTKDVQIDFTPSLPIQYLDTLILVHNDPDTNELMVRISGFGTKPTIGFSWDTLDFGPVLSLDEDSTCIFIHNTGNEGLRIMDLDGSGGVFSLDDREKPSPEQPWEVAAADSIALPIRFSPSDTGKTSAEWTLMTNDPDRPMATLSLAGTGVAPIIRVAGRSFSITTSQEQPVAFEVWLGNDGTYPLNYVIENNVSWYGIQWIDTDKTGGTIEPGGLDTIVVSNTNLSSLNVGEEYFGDLIVVSKAAGTQDLHLCRDTLDIGMRLLSAGIVAAGEEEIGGGNLPPLPLMDNEGNSLGLILDFHNTAGGSIGALMALLPPPIDTSTTFIDPDGVIDTITYADCYWELINNLSGAFAVDIVFSYNLLKGVYKPLLLRLARRDGFAGAGVPWQLIELADLQIDTTLMEIRARNQTAFSQWSIVSDPQDNPFADTRRPTIADIQSSPALPSLSDDIDINATITDESDLQDVRLHYIKGGDDVFTSAPMSLISGVAFGGTIPASEASLMGIAYYLSAADALQQTRNSDTISIRISFAADTLAINLGESLYPTGFPRDKWRLISVPTELDRTNVLETIGDELGERTAKTWRIFALGEGGYEENPIDLNLGMGYWLYQRSSDDLVFRTGSGTTTDLNGVECVLDTGWNFIGSPYPFAVSVDVDQLEFYGPLTYALNGSEGWSDVVDELLPWAGYAIYNRDTETPRSILLNPLDGSQSIAKKINDLPGWRLQVKALGETYSDVGNYLGRIEGAQDGRDHFDNPEPPYVDGYISLTLVVPGQESTNGRFTSDIRAIDIENGVWDLDLRTKGAAGPISVASELQGDKPADFRVALIDIITREVTNMLASNEPLLIHDYREEFPYHFKAVAGSQAYVEATVEKILAGLPTEFALQQNYPNPFNPITTIKYVVPRPEKVSLQVYNILGQEVITLVNEWQDLGEHEVVWNSRDGFGRELPSGIYFARLRVPGIARTVKMVLLK